MAIASINPANGEKLREFEPHNDVEIEKTLRQATAAFEKHRREPFPKRALLMTSVASLLEQEKQELARTITLEMGKLFRDSVAEIEKCVSGCRYYAENAERFLEDEPAQTSARRSYVHYEPIGPVLAIMPLNFPFWQVFRFAAPALMAGNGAILKHASNVPGCALAIEEVFLQAGLPRGLFRTLLLPSRDVEGLIKDENIAAVTLTGSVAAGRSVATAAGSVLKKCVLELGGSDAYIILEDADMQAAAKIAATARMVNGGQSCIAGKRFIVVRSVLEPFEKALDRKSVV